MSTKGDQDQNRPLASFGGKGVFTKELEEALLAGKIDLAVHSAKDLPMEFPEGLGICAVPEREDPRDVIITRRRHRPVRSAGRRCTWNEQSAPGTAGKADEILEFRSRSCVEMCIRECKN